jgi:hypothetical protein
MKRKFSDLESQMITSDGNIKRYVNSDIVDEFKVGQAADISFPNGYNKANRVFDVCPTLTPTTIKNIVVKVIDK